MCILCLSHIFNIVFSVAFSAGHAAPATKHLGCRSAAAKTYPICNSTALAAAAQLQNNTLAHERHDRRIAPGARARCAGHAAPATKHLGCRGAAVARLLGLTPYAIQRRSPQQCNYKNNTLAHEHHYRGIASGARTSTTRPKAPTGPAAEPRRVK